MSLCIVHQTQAIPFVYITTFTPSLSCDVIYYYYYPPFKDEIET